jgi:hypothetical protein
LFNITRFSYLLLTSICHDILFSLKYVGKKPGPAQIGGWKREEYFNRLSEGCGYLSSLRRHENWENDGFLKFSCVWFFLGLASNY